MKTGDFVRLKTGSNTMMVAAVNSEEVECIQYNGQKISHGTFLLKSLEQVFLPDFNWKPPRTP
jgi:uncharacterized protein YodC (DUF2158 family)